MKYFKKELWKAFNDDSIPFDKAAKEWSRNSTLYKKQISKVVSRLGSRTRSFFKDVALLHDGKLVRFEAGDMLAVSSSRKNNPQSPETKIVVASDQNCLFTILYRGVRRILFDFPSSQPLFAQGTIGDWGYDELTSVNSKVFRHEILFSSGAIILIESSDIAVQVGNKYSSKARK